MKGVLPWFVRWARRVGTKDFYPALGALVSPVENFFSSSHVPIAKKIGQTVVLGRLSLSLIL